MSRNMLKDIRTRLEDMHEQGLYKEERILTGPQSARVTVRRNAPHTDTAPRTDGSSKPDTSSRGAGGGTGNGADREVINFCANNYLGLSNNPEIVQAAQRMMEQRGYGLSSVRFICGTQDTHKELEEAVSRFLRTEDSILYAAAFDANGGVFEPLLGAEDAIISDELNHASIIDGVRLCKAKRYRYTHADMESLEEQLRAASDARYRVIATDGVFSMDGDIAPLPEIVRLAESYDALTMVDDCHATGYLGAGGRGTAEYYGIEGDIDIITTTFGKALGGASGGCTSGRKEIIEYLRQRSRPYLFSNTLAPAIVGGTLKAIELLERDTSLKAALEQNVRLFRDQISNIGLDLLEGSTAIVPVMVYDEQTAVKMADLLLEKGIYVIGFTYPVVPRGKARIRVQLSAAHSSQDIEQAVAAFAEAGRELGLL
ncbi:MAG: glycine C-acetyltransferase [Spirochaetota bacterium]